MKITDLNIDDIIRTEKRKLLKKNISDFAIYWGKAGFEALNKFFGATICDRNKKGEFLMHMGICSCDGAELTEKDQGITFLGIKHFWNKNKSGYKVKKHGKL